MGLKAMARSRSGEVTTSYELLDVIFDGILAGAGGFSRPANRQRRVPARLISRARLSFSSA